jgi:hypothetical protein
MNKLKTLLVVLKARLNRLGRYALPLFICLVALTYGFLLLRVTTLSRAEPDQQQVDSQVNASQVLRINPDVVKQLNSLQDNSVNVQALFDQARSNPF